MTAAYRVFFAFLMLCSTMVMAACDEEASSNGSGDADGDTDSDTSDDLPQICDDFSIDASRMFDEVAYLASDEMGGRLPGSEGNEAAMVLVEDLFELLGLAPAGDGGTYRQSFTFQTGGAPYDVASVDSANVLGVMEGNADTLGDELIIVGAHLDHMGTDDSGGVFNGADDNASGVAVLMEIARSMVCSGISPERTVLFAGWNAEDSGTGSGAQHFIDNPFVPLEDIVTVLVLDMVGAGDQSGVVVYNGVGENSWIGDLVTGSVADDGLEYTIDPRETGSAWSDQVPFHQAGVPAVLLLTLPGLQEHSGYHTIADDITNVAAGDMEVAARVTWSSLKTLATGTEGDYL